VRAFINCSEPCKPASFDRFVAAFAGSGVRAEQLQCCYAMAETVFAAAQTLLGAPPRRITVDPLSLERGAQPRPAPPGQGLELIETGKPIAGVEVSVHDAAGSPLVGGEVGEIGLRGAFLFSGYNADPERTAERLRGGTYFSHDLGFLQDGRLYVLGRIDDLIIINGRNLYAHEVEAQVGQIPGVKPGRAVAAPWFDPRIGSETLVIMAERSGTAETDMALRREIAGRIHSVFGVTPRAVTLLDPGALVKTTSGKISRSENLARYLAAQVGGGT
jgi:acyl-CoA synthetase (AMP-forming)/AMP-acid ligase II